MEQMILTEQQQADIKRLAAAMRAGAKIRPQATGVLFRRVWTVGDNLIHSCALGAAWEGEHPGFNPQSWLMNIEQEQTDNSFIGLYDIEKHFGLVPGVDCIDPFTLTPSMVSIVIIDMNDRKGYTREMIADWLETLVYDVHHWFGMPIKDWPDSLRNTMNRVKPGSGDGIAETIQAWIKAHGRELDADLQPIR